MYWEWLISVQLFLKARGLLSKCGEGSISVHLGPGGDPTFSKGTCSPRLAPRAQLGLSNLRALSWAERCLLESTAFLPRSLLPPALWWDIELHVSTKIHRLMLLWTGNVVWYTESSQKILKYFLASFSSSLTKCVGRENLFTVKEKMVSLKGAAEKTVQMF